VDKLAEVFAKGDDLYEANKDGAIYITTDSGDNR